MQIGSRKRDAVAWSDDDGLVFSTGVHQQRTTAVPTALRFRNRMLEQVTKLQDESNLTPASPSGIRIYVAVRRVEVPRPVAEELGALGYAQPGSELAAQCGDKGLESVVNRRTPWHGHLGEAHAPTVDVGLDPAFALLGRLRPPAGGTIHLASQQGAVPARQ